jgi:hypothetical protein
MSFSSTPNRDSVDSSSQTFAVGTTSAADSDGFVDRRGSLGRSAGGERRQFGSAHSGLSEAGRELAVAIDQYKVQNHRRYITCDEMLSVLTELGYSK